MALAALGAVLACLPGAAARANPTPHELSQQLDAASQQLETVIEQYNSTRVRLSATQAQQAALAAQMAPVARAIDALENQIGTYSAGLYEHIDGGPVTALIAAGSPGDLLDQLTMLDHLSAATRRQVSELQKEQQRYAQQKRDLDLLLAQQTVQQTDLATKRTRIEAQIAELRQLRFTLYGGHTPYTPTAPA
ncbi:MAG: hypothetical protein AUI14_22355 [Actinobacteria bacterium 13_2_20CM_2_71_6]|nr:MAG: hypothetical protein AUI14_22355 [Actinobacteria bacterium 13_2_20CM_2_71_6]